jgi:hypothetical protein
VTNEGVLEALNEANDVDVFSNDGEDFWMKTDDDESDSDTELKSQSENGSVTEVQTVSIVFVPHGAM